MFEEIQKQLEQIKLEIEDIANSEDVAKALVEFYPDQGTYLNPATHIDEWNGWLDVEVLQSFGEIDTEIIIIDAINNGKGLHDDTIRNNSN